MKRCCLALLIFAVLLAGCARLPAVMEDPQDAVETPDTSQTPVVTAAPDPIPAPDPVPAPLPTPKIQEAWYRERTEQMRSWMETYGAYADEAAIDSQLALWEIDPDKPMIALTFDDGPKPGITDKIMDVLLQYNARATFFVLGWRLKKDPEITAALMQRMLAQGCEIGNHTWSHQIMVSMSAAEIRDQIMRTNKIINDLTGYTPRAFRPPGGTGSGKTRYQAERLDMAVTLWSQSGNVKLSDPHEIADTVLLQQVNGRALQSGDIVLLHDTKDYMVTAMEILIPKLLEQGYQLVTVQELLRLSENGFVSGEVYRCQ